MPTLLSADVVMPDFVFRISNPVQVVQAMGREELARVKQRVRAGQGSRGPLPRSKDGRPWVDTGQLLDSLEADLRQPRSANGLPYVLVLPTGLRDEAGQVGRARQRRIARRRGAKRRELTELRKAGVLGLGEAGIRSRAARAAAAARAAGRQGVRVSSFRAIIRRAERKGRYGISDAEIRKRARNASKLGYRQARRNMDVAAILMNKPKDPRAKAGNRGRYIVLEATKEDWRVLQRIAVKLARFELQEKQTGIRHRGRGQAA